MNDMEIKISKDSMYQHLVKLLEYIFRLPEVKKVVIRNIEIISSDSENSIRNALEASYHDRFSDVDIHIYVNLHPENCGESFVYYQYPQRLGLIRDNYLGLMLGGAHDVPVLRVAMKNGMRYDLDFHITEDFSAPILHFSQEEQIDKRDGRFWPDWDLKKADAFWFNQIQALGKLYRGDYLIADHLANMQINETLVAQMVMRDDQYGTNIHRYGHYEELDYQNVKQAEKVFRNQDNTFQGIADKLYAAAISYDRLVKQLNSRYEPQSSTFFAIWRVYDESEIGNE